MPHPILVFSLLLFIEKKSGYYEEEGVDGGGRGYGGINSDG